MWERCSAVLNCSIGEIAVNVMPPLPPPCFQEVVGPLLEGKEGEDGEVCVPCSTVAGRSGVAHVPKGLKRMRMSCRRRRLSPKQEQVQKPIFGRWVSCYSSSCVGILLLVAQLATPWMCSGRFSKANWCCLLSCLLPLQISSGPSSRCHPPLTSYPDTSWPICAPAPVSSSSSGQPSAFCSKSLSDPRVAQHACCW